MAELKNYIKSYFGIHEEDLAIVATHFTLTTLKKGDFFVKKGHYCTQLSFVKNGLLRIYANAGTKDITQWISTEGSFITDLQSFALEQTARWNIQALSDCELYTITREDYKKLSSEIPKWEEIHNRFITVCFSSLENRIFSHLSMTAEERYEALFKSNPALFNQVPLQYIASMLGMTPETFSRIRNKIS
ncbi:Crp/Fnr family transcriptional regulator [Flavobacterium sp. '19STA2R22 D10 B1']|uniref:Crp/Fnr family transcriptional regulator n=1 Tax=Flavobacterium aerium TaxID=3037261 RepID=UPI00278BE085|nr:Crp/Fnr family transcriptional regulator [Flavobacterium sp. '19STA2R22 D10 B1']